VYRGDVLPPVKVPPVPRASAAAAAAVGAE